MLEYFRKPFPSTQGFSAYRMPGVAVHGPLFLAFTFLGFALCWPHSVLRPFSLVWALAGLYLGRDVAILCHYSPLLTLLAWAACAMVLFNSARISRFGAAHVVIPSILSIAVGTILFLVAYSMTREKARDSG